MINKSVGGMANKLVRDSVTLGVLERIVRAWSRGLEGAGLELLGRELEQIVPCDRVYLLQLSASTGEVLVASVYHGVDGGLHAGQILPEAAQVIELMRGTLGTMACSDTRLWANGLERKLADEGMHASVGLVLSWQEQPLGVLVLASRQSLVYGPAEVRLLRQLCPTLGAHLWKAQQQARVQRQKAESDNERERTLMAVIGGITHHFNNFLAYLLGSLELMGECEAETERQELLGRLQGRVVEGSQMLRALQQFAAQELPEQREEIEISELMEEVIELTRPVWEATIRARGAKIIVEHSPVSHLKVHGNRRDLKEAFINVLFNAIQALPQGGHIWISEGRDHIWNYVQVMDEGVGMSKEVAKRAREPFFTTQPGQRQGLGLSVATGIIRRHGGEMSIASESGQGTTTRFNLLSAEQLG